MNPTPGQLQYDAMMQALAIAQIVQAIFTCAAIMMIPRLVVRAVELISGEVGGSGRYDDYYDDADDWGDDPDGLVDNATYAAMMADGPDMSDDEIFWDLYSNDAWGQGTSVEDARELFERDKTW